MAFFNQCVTLLKEMIVSSRNEPPLGLGNVNFYSTEELLEELAKPACKEDSVLFQFLKPQRQPVEPAALPKVVPFLNNYFAQRSQKSFNTAFNTAFVLPQV